MPPKIKVTSEAIVDAALEIVRKGGAQSLNARTVAAALTCSTQPVFSNFETMEQLRDAVARKADAISQEYIRREVETGQYPVYKASGMAYIRFAKEERELFKLLYMCDREGVPIPAETELNSRMETLVHNNTGLTGEDVQLFHFEMWACVHGIATMFATGYLDIPWELVSKMLTDVYQGLRKQYTME